MPLTLGASRSWTEAWFRCRHPEDLRAANQLSTTALRLGWDRFSQVVRHTLGDGLRWFRDEAVIQPLGPGRWQLAGVTMDITEQHLAAQAVAQQNERLRRGLLLAREIQLGLLPRDLPLDTPRLAVAAHAQPAAEVGGDYYTCQLRSPAEVLLTVGDISGKGVGAALMMALASSATEHEAAADVTPAQLLATLNAQLGERLRANHMHAALLCIAIDVERRELTAANAGMIAPFLVRAGQATLIDAAGLPLGAMPAARYADVHARVQPGDRIVLVSDGIVEARDADGQLFGFERLEATLAAADPAAPLEALIDTVLGAVQTFLASAEQGDDITIVAAEVR
jgi:serine phosphatase RsbU (regulator of sigma subunit)